MPSREDTVNIVLQVNMVSVFSVFNAKHFPFDCDFFPDERLAYARNVIRMKLSSGLPVVHLPALSASTRQSSQNKHYQYTRDSCSRTLPSCRAFHVENLGPFPPEKKIEKLNNNIDLVDVFSRTSINLTPAPLRSKYNF
jgi:hypothetical protein